MDKTTKMLSVIAQSWHVLESYMTEKQREKLSEHIVKKLLKQGVYPVDIETNFDKSKDIQSALDKATYYEHTGI